MVVFLFPFSSWGCTLFGAVGDATENPSTLIGKNRDFNSFSINKLEFSQNKEGFRYFAIMGEEKGESTGVKAGINQEGLVVLSATAGSIPKEERLNIPDKKSMIYLNDYILTHFSNVKETLENKHIFINYKPCFIMLADKERLAVIEIGFNKEISIKESENGVLYHTNHYVDENMTKFNKKETESSLVRYKRIEKLLTQRENPLSMVDFIAFSQNREDGADNGIWRTGSDPEKTRTSATWIVEIPQKGAPRLFIKIANIGEREKCYSFVLNEKFWSSHK